MAFSCDQLVDQYQAVRGYARDFSGDIVLETNKRMVARFTRDYDARGFMLTAKYHGYVCSMKRGLQSAALYVQALTNSPF